MKQIVMVTDGKPTACFIGDSVPAGRMPHRLGLGGEAGLKSGSTRRLYKNSMGGDPFVMADAAKPV
jgi:hypothetical protein